MDTSRDGEAGTRRAAGAHRRRADERPTGASAEPRRREETDDRFDWRDEPGAAPPASAPGPDPVQPPSSEPAKAAGWLIVGTFIAIVALLLLPWFIFSVAIAAPLVLAAVVVAGLLLAARRRKREWPSSPER